MAREIQSRNEFFIGGEWIPASSDRRFKLINASTGAPLASVPEAVEADIDRAVAAARQAFDDPSGWASWAPAERAAAMKRFSEAMGKRASETAAAVSQQNGMPISFSQILEGDSAVGLLDYYTKLAGDLPGPEARPNPMGKETVVSRAPIGVVAAIVPWNFPVTLAMSKIGPALAAGCTMVIKPSPGTVLDSYVLAEAAAEAQFPPGVLNWAAADREVGAYLVSHPGVDRVAFTGSTAAGRSIARTCGELLRPVSLELGGKSAAILLEDADLDVFLKGIPTASLLNNGQTCYACTRLLLPRSRYAEMLDAIASMVSSLRIGDAMDTATQMGPMASEAQRQRVEGYIARGKNEARLVTGGTRPDGPGWFIEPTVFADVSNDSTIAREEIFGPVLSVIPYSTEEEAIHMANASDYGLGGTVWSADDTHARQVASRVETGTIGINGYIPSFGSPFGGVKASGIGREFGPEAVASYQQLRSTYVMG